MSCCKQSLLVIFFCFYSIVVSSGQERRVKLSSKDDIIDKTPEALIRLRGFEVQTHFAKTKDGYNIHLVRIINPKNKGEQSIAKRPVIFNHGLFESSTIWLINSQGVSPQTPPEQCKEVGEAKNVTTRVEISHVNGPMMLANNGYDVWLMSMRGTDWSLKHDSLSPKNPRFWDYCLDDFALSDVPTVVDYVAHETKAPKIGYIGHSQATFSVFGLLSFRPRYAKIIEPVVAVAPVAFFDHIRSIARLLFTNILKSTQPNKHGPFPPNARALRKIMAAFCRKKKNFSCQLMNTLVSGQGKPAFEGAFNHLPFFTSLKVLRQFGQLIESRRNQMYDYGAKMNLRVYGRRRSPTYPIHRIKSKSLCLISTKTDALSPPEDVERFKRRLTVPIYKDIFIDRNFNHMDLITDIEASVLVFKPILEIFESFERNSTSCENEKPQVEEKESNSVSND